MITNYTYYTYVTILNRKNQTKSKQKIVQLFSL